MWKLKTYKTNVGDYPDGDGSGTRIGDYASVWEKELELNPMLTNAVKRRIDMIYEYIQRKEAEQQAVQDCDGRIL